MKELKNKVREMQRHCKANKYCISKDDVVCPYREMCIDYLKNSFEGRVPGYEWEEKIFKSLCKLDKYKNKHMEQKFYNSQGEYHISTHPAGNYWRRLQYTYCKKRGFKIQASWLDFQRFAEWYDIMSCDGKYSPVLKQEKGVIDETTIKWVKK